MSLITCTSRWSTLVYYFWKWEEGPNRGGNMFKVPQQVSLWAEVFSFFISHGIILSPYFCFRSFHKEEYIYSWFQFFIALKSLLSFIYFYYIIAMFSLRNPVTSCSLSNDIGHSPLAFMTPFQTSQFKTTPVKLTFQRVLHGCRCLTLVCLWLWGLCKGKGAQSRLPIPLREQLNDLEKLESR